MGKNKSKHKKNRDAQHKSSDDHIVTAPVVERASDHAQASRQEEQKGQSGHDGYLAASRENVAGSQDDVRRGTDNHANDHTHKHTHQHAPCQSPALRKRVQNLTSALILVTGLGVGSLFVDVAQFFTERGLSAKALGEAQVVEYDGATWVRYDEPKVNAELYISENNSAQVREKADKMLSALAFFIPTLEVRLVSIDDEEGARRALDAGIGYAPAMHFSAALGQNAYYTHSREVFTPREDGTYILKMDEVDVPVDYHIDAPNTDMGMVIGQVDAPHSVVVFEQFTCESCGTLHATLAGVQAKYPQDLKIVYKNIPVPSDEASRASAYAGHCAYAQGSYDDYANILYTNSAWKSVKGDVRDGLFLQYSNYIWNLDKIDFETCYRDRAYEGQLVADITEAERLGITEMPTAFLDGTAFLHDDTSAAFETVLAEQIEATLTQ